MEKIDRLVWAEGFTFTSFGVRIGIRSNQPGLSRHLERVLPPGYRLSTSSAVEALYSLIVGSSNQDRGIRRLNVLYDGAARIAREMELPPVLNILQTQIRRTVAEMAPRRVFVHAGVIEHKGRAIVIPGPSMSGKSTLVAELLKLGATYYSDEYAVLDDRGRVAPFAKPLSLRAPGTYDSTDFDVAEMGATIGKKAVPVGMVAIMHFSEGAKWRPRTLSRGLGTLELLAHSIAARREPQRVMGALHRALKNAHIVKGTRGEASEAAKELLGALADSSARSFAPNA